MNAENQKAEEKPVVSVAIYTRKSGDENLDGTVTSIDSQKAACRSFIDIQRERGWREFPEAFDDPAESGKNLQRPSMKRLLQVVEAKKIQAIIVYKLDRISRSSKDFYQLVELFEKNNVALVSATESIDTKSPQGRLMTYIMMQFAQYDRELDQERSKDFHLARARRGLWCGGLPPLGFDTKDRSLVINEEEAQLVRRIFDLYLEHRSSIKVAEELNRLGFRRKTYRIKDGRIYGGALFDEDSVIRILQRKVYVGKIVNDRTGLEFTARHKPIVESGKFEEAQKILEAHKKREGGEYAANKHGFRLKGLVRCGDCGSAVVGYVRPKKNKVYRYYRCLAKVDGQRVPCKFLSSVADRLEDQVVQRLNAISWDRPFVEIVVRKAEKLCREGIVPLEQERNALEARLQNAKRDLQNLINFVKAGGASEHVSGEIRRLEAVKNEVEPMIAKLRRQIIKRKNMSFDVDTVQAALKKFARFMYAIPLPQQIKIIRLLIQRVRVWRDRVELDFHEEVFAGLKGLMAARANT